MSHFTVLVTGDDIEAALAPYDEGIRVARYVDSTKAQIIENARASLQSYVESPRYREFEKDRTGYILKNAHNPGHCRYVSEEVPLKLTWTDEQHYADSIKYEDPENLGPDGELYSTYNPLSKWDWYVVGGRWDGHLIDAGGEGRNVLKKADLDVKATAPTYTVLHEGTWTARGDMGWFGMSHNETDDWEATWRARVEALPGDLTLTLVDAHI